MESHGDQHAGSADAGIATGGAAAVGGSATIAPYVGGSSNTGGDVANTSPGVYMLPAGFTPGEFGGFKLGASLQDTGSGGGLAGNSSADCGPQIVGVVRDFKGKTEPGGDPDFENFTGELASEGMVKDVLGTDRKPVYSVAGAFEDDLNGQQTTSKAFFDEWYRTTPGVNKPYLIYFYLQPNGNVRTFESDAFFPLDGQGWGNTPKQDHNFGFTTEVHTAFLYKGGETFAFTGDDDLWVFINGKLAIDLGGLHGSLDQSVSLDQSAPQFGIVVGGSYPLDLFHAERRAPGSDFRIDTDLEFTNCGQIIDEPPPR